MPPFFPSHPLRVVPLFVSFYHPTFNQFRLIDRKEVEADVFIFGFALGNAPAYCLYFFSPHTLVGDVPASKRAPSIIHFGPASGRPSQSYQRNPRDGRASNAHQWDSAR